MVILEFSDGHHKAVKITVVDPAAIAGDFRFVGRMGWVNNNGGWKHIGQGVSETVKGNRPQLCFACGAEQQEQRDD
jgi:hypothetical protein